MFNYACYHAAMAATATLTHPLTVSTEVPLEEYPYSDGRVLMETDPHANSIVAIRNQLQWHFAGLRDVYVAGSMAVYYREGDRSAVVAPDVFVVLGVAKRDRKSYRIWDEGGVAPTFVVEVASSSTYRLDSTDKRETYERMGVREYWRFDPVGDLIAQGLEGWRLGRNGYKPVRQTRSTGRYRSEALGLELRAEEWLLRFRDPRLGRDLMTYAEVALADQEKERKLNSTERKLSSTERKLSSTERKLDSTERKLSSTERKLSSTEHERDVATKKLDESNRRVHELETILRLAGLRGSDAERSG